jgi:hypothetical protein
MRFALTVPNFGAFADARAPGHEYGWWTPLVSYAGLWESRQDAALLGAEALRTSREQCA